VRQRRQHAVEVESLAEFDRRVASGATGMAGWRLQDVDLRERADVLRRLDPRGALLLGCALRAASEGDLRRRGALIFPEVPDVPIDPYRGGLYTPDELYDGLGTGYDGTLDARVYAWATSQTHDLHALLAQSLHDLAVDDALEEFVAGRRLVGVMGGHDLPRGSAAFAQAARLGRSLAAAGLTVASGGGPGAMEAANLGAYLSEAPDKHFRQALAELAVVPGFRPSVSAWARAASAVVERHPDGTPSLGIPTWFYGHEPPNVFCNGIGKYFSNALREDGLLARSTAGLVVLEGAAGTVQEIFQAATPLYYSREGAALPVVVLVGRRHWTELVPVWPALTALASGRAMAEHLHLVDSVDEASELVLAAARG
jgi:predicted Rossmann-fold nucleotide-binding protein